MRNKLAFLHKLLLTAESKLNYNCMLIASLNGIRSFIYSINQFTRNHQFTISSIQQILTLRLVAEKAHRKNQCVYDCFIDFTKAFDTVRPDLLWAVFRSYGVNGKLV